MIVLCPVPGLVRRRCPAAHRNPLPRWIQTVNPLTMGFVQQSPPADVYFGRGPAILAEREKIKKLIIQNRRLIHQGQAA
jgi:hypothetical protein